MQLKLDSASMGSRTIALLAPRSGHFWTGRRKFAKAVTPFSELERARQAVVRTSAGESIAWLAVALSAITVLGLSLCF